MWMLNCRVNLNTFLRYVSDISYLRCLLSSSVIFFLFIFNLLSLSANRNAYHGQHNPHNKGEQQQEQFRYPKHQFQCHKHSLQYPFQYGKQYHTGLSENHSRHKTSLLSPAVNQFHHGWVFCFLCITCCFRFLNIHAAPARGSLRHPHRPGSERRPKQHDDLTLDFVFQL